MMKSALLVLHVAFITDTCFSQSALDVSKLHDDLVTLNPSVRPVSDVTQPTQISISFHLTSIISLDTASQKLVSNGWVYAVWHNPYINWDPQDYGGALWISLQPERLWRPRLTVLNTLEELQPIGGKNDVLSMVSTGVVFWFLTERFETFCQVDVTYFPFDVQQCRWKFFSWAEGTNEIVMNATQPKINLDSFQENGEWTLEDTKAWGETYLLDGAPCSVLTYEVTLRRRATLLTQTVLLPVFVQCLLNVFVFTIPSQAGERLAYAMTSLLSHGVFMSFIVHLTPSSSETVSIVAATQSCDLILSGICVLFCILSLRFFHRDPNKHPVPPYLQTVIVCLEMMLCSDPPPDASSRHQDEMPSEVEATTSEGQSEVGKADMTGKGPKGHLDRWALKRKVKQEAYTQPQDMTWQRVSRTLDKLFFRFFFGLVIVSGTAVVAVLAVHRHCGISQ